MDCANDPHVRSVCLMWGSQLTKTTVLENVNGFFIHLDPAPILLVQPTVEMAQAWSKERFNATVRDTPVLRDIISEQKSRDSGNTIQLKTFPGGNLAIIGSNAPAGLAGRPRRVVLLDEVDRYPASAGTEGDPVMLAIRRTESFYNSVIYLTSTPTIKGASRIENEYEQTDKRKWFCPCPKCGHFQTLEWSGVKWDKDKPETACYQCAKCEAHWTDRDRVQAVRGGEWRATALFSGKRGYFLNGICSPFKPKRGFASRLHQMATEFLEAKAGGSEQLKTWTNTFLAETWEDPAETLELSTVASRVESYTPDTLPDRIAWVCGGADVQKDRIEIEWVGLGESEETWGIETLKVYGDTEKQDTWTRMAGELTRKFKREDGAVLSPTALAIDFHYKPRIVKDFSLKHGTACKVLLVIGVGTSRQPGIYRECRDQYGLVYYTLLTDQFKDMLFSRFRLDAPGPRYMHLPRGYGYDDEWFRQLTSERAIIKHSHGFAKRIYEKRDGARNEAIDMRVYALAAMEIMRPDIAAWAASLKPKPTQPAQPIHTDPFAMPARPGGGWVNGWR